MKQKTIAIDFDGVIHDYKNPVPGKRMGPPFVGAEEGIDDLIQRGYKIVIFTVKATTEEGKDVVEQWLDHYGIDFHEITAVKPNAEFYVDDRGIRHQGWFSTMRDIDALTGYVDE